MRRAFLIGSLLLLALGLFLHFRRVGGNVETMAAAGSAHVEVLGPFRGVESRGRFMESTVETRQIPPKVSVSREMIADGEWILSFPLAEPQMIIWALTNALIPAPEAKGLLRSALAHLHAGFVYKERLAELELKELSEMKAIRENDLYSNEDKTGFALVKAAAFRGSREKWMADREEWLKEFNTWIASLGVQDPSALMRDLLLIQPSAPPPDPKP